MCSTHYWVLCLSTLSRPPFLAYAGLIDAFDVHWSYCIVTSQEYYVTSLDSIAICFQSRRVSSVREFSILFFLYFLHYLDIVAKYYGERTDAGGVRENSWKGSIWFFEV
jgi:hypothetical protein